MKCSVFFFFFSTIVFYSPMYLFAQLFFLFWWFIWKHVKVLGGEMFIYIYIRMKKSIAECLCTCYKIICIPFGVTMHRTRLCAQFNFFFHSFIFLFFYFYTERTFLCFQPACQIVNLCENQYSLCYIWRMLSILPYEKKQKLTKKITK